MGGTLPPSRGTVGKNWSARSKTTVSSKRGVSPWVKGVSPRVKRGPSYHSNLQKVEVFQIFTKSKYLLLSISSATSLAKIWNKIKLKKNMYVLTSHFISKIDFTTKKRTLVSKFLQQNGSF